MTMPATLEGRLECGTPGCPTVFTLDPLPVHHGAYTDREILRRNAEPAGWRVCSGGLDRCPACATGPADFLIPGWVQRWTPPDPDAEAVRQLLHANSDPTGTFAVVNKDGGDQ
ncbi:hypothetical protein [Microbispora sp. KK1-11]|uniref:hypothetical protein n=1 Tax=Microbispora sp. KK1-11 TaxID=2053005 RepID=UPI0011587BE5|nr:hypothetical protein [Microbispora sp. KK1-11]TQS29154.1 hypothetical protein FLW16_12495 [Microbispora sp. KK1-11]